MQRDIWQHELFFWKEKLQRNLYTDTLAQTHECRCTEKLIYAARHMITENRTGCRESFQEPAILLVIT